ncbi:DEAD/DEAH box helicase domain protein OS=Tsukamurella paurometabola (strain ATCC 8368 / DSM/ CCUG 35730 / CIP 100753 / JCM 10117 / KCTC 9821 / NBRC 16120/ NCIMB 702349 / NCTC 13040) OX=521096 GN=Tpau_1821 PE=4 SV=1 [Tsukamurella paurometabola]|uniref:DEAD/DEAH box helicase domain protein n=1 Tax=Tsukamurella paurometabola (strain ATCC 8368 / DSM 20162 / CCUG 35730 / CIP 100753 / JCM 10117 / KCTC 9821 / NBRC 16120 / NCIMB 702349 / NCTC 13040) TaxID=521096 RepID=D5UMU2_TSUPD|nr:DEAD/DEAH box helicase [Tsukamurella paurometabola]ADG78439.1 DEAD/DEAH box helicase domain protein [Tsukamurella paurometabola DSM 20162]SUP31637.1 ski2-like helicase [Tsukamurella paurometabola]
MNLSDLLPADPTADACFEAFTDWTTDRGIELYPAQEEALIAACSGANVIVATPTGSGKSLVAMGAQFAALAQGRRTYYTAPIKALVSEKFFALCEVFGTANVGMVTGDAAVNPDAPIVCATAEIVANLALRQGADSDIAQVVMDEFHFYSEPDRGWAWQVPLIELPRAQFVLMSATLGDTSFFEDDLTRRTGRETVLVAGAERPVPLHFSYSTMPIQDQIVELVTTHQAPVYVVHFTQQAAAERAQALMSLPLCSKERKAAIAEALGDFQFTTGFGKTLSRLIRSGVGVHHAGMLPRYRRLVEKLAQDGLLTVICGTDTLGVGINVPIRTVYLTGLTKYDGTRTRHLRAREFHQIAGRAGRAGFDTLGTVVVAAPEHEIENARLEAKAAGDPKKLKKIQRKKPPEGFVSWGKPTFDKLVAADPEPLVSRFAVTNSLLLNVIARPQPCFDSMRHLLEDNHETRRNQLRHIRTAITLYRGLEAGGVVERHGEPDEFGRYARLTVDLQPDFALNQPLAPFALAALELLDPESPEYALDVISVIESVLDDPRTVLRAQQNAARGAAVAEMKADGIDYDERMALLEDVTYPKPLDELLVPAFATYAAGHAWVTQFELSPKSVVREMIERAMTFNDFVSRYQLGRSEGAVLRYLSDAYRTLRHTVPENARTAELEDYIAWLGALVRYVDSSLVDEWEEMTSPDPLRAHVEAPELTRSVSLTDDARAFTVMVRNAMFRRVQLVAEEEYDLLDAMDPGVDWYAAFDDYYEEYDDIDTGPGARGPHLFSLDTSLPRAWKVRQTIADPNGDHGWAITATVDLPASDERGDVVLADVAVVAG